MQTPFQMTQRHPPNSTDPTRHPYIPTPPPPTASAPGAQNHGVPLPPPPPRTLPNQSHGMAVPPPPGGSGNNQYGWQGAWARQPFAQQQFGQHVAYNPNAYHTYQSGPVQMQPAAPPENQPLTSATYIPFGESFGPGVGIPPLHPGHTQHQPQWQAVDQQHTFYNTENVEYAPGGDTLRSIQGPGQTPEMNVQLLREVNPTLDNDAARYYTQKQTSTGEPNAQHSATTMSPLNHNHRQSDSSVATPLTPQDSGLQWPLERVLSWLATNSFSNDWHKTFKTLDVHGSQFLELGRGHGGRGNVGQMHSLIYPQLAKECTQSGSGWDQSREREEGKRLRKLIRNIVDIAPSSTSKFGHRSSGAGAGTENAPESSRPEGHSSTPTTADWGDDSPGPQTAFNQNKGVSTAPNSQRRFSPQKDSAQTLSSTPLDSNTSEIAHRSTFSEAILKGVNEESSVKKGSPSESRETITSTSLGNGGRTESSRRSYESSPQLSPAVSNPRLPSASTNGASSSTSHSRYHGHKRGVSSESSHSGVAQEGKSKGQESARTTPVDASGRPGSNELPISAREHKGFLNKFMRSRQKKDDPHHSPEDLHLESPTSPIAIPGSPINTPFFETRINSSETSLDRSLSKTTQSELDKSVRNVSRSRKVSPVTPRRFVMITPDGWTYRLVEVSEVDSAELWKNILCHELDLPDSRDVNVYHTVPGQYEHNETLSDSQIMQALQKADSGGSVKMFIQSSFQAAQHSTASPSAASSEILTPATDPTSIERAESLKKVRSSQDSTAAMLAERVDGSVTHNNGIKDLDRKTSLQLAAEKHRREVERKQKAYLTERKNRFRNPSPAGSSPTSATSGGVKKRDVVIDFDSPRLSPFEEKKFEKLDPLVPRRKPPPVPPISNTLIKANSLSRKPTTQSRQSWPDRIDLHRKRASDELSVEDATERGRRAPLVHSTSTASGVAGALAEAGKLSSAFGVPFVPSISSGVSKSSSVRSADDALQEPTRKALQAALSIRTSSPGSPGSPGFTMSKGNVPFKIPDYDPNPPEDVNAHQPSQIQAPTNATLSKVKETEQSDSPDTSPSTVKPPKLITRVPTRKLNGPTFEFKENPITFDKSPAKKSHDSSDDSDDGLFAIPLKSGTKQKAASAPLGVPSGQGETSPERGSSRIERPSLTLKTSRSKKGLSVAFGSPKLAPSPQYSAGDHSAESDQTVDRGGSADRPFPESAASASWSAESPNEISVDYRRQSFASDVWAFRPPTEALVEHLDDFFPNFDLDQPVLEDRPSSPTSSPGPSKTIKPTRKESKESIRSDGDLSSIEQTFAKRHDRIHGIGRRSVGLGRTKSIREVVKGAYQHPDKPAVPGISRINTLKAEIGRRKSTKMFGAKIEQIKASRGHRLPDLETIPQDTSAPIPQRQQTFKWVKGQLIGKGTFGRVYLGMNMTTGELLAVKQVEVTPKLAGQDKDKMKEMVKALDQEIDTMQHLDHVNIVQYLGCERKEYSISIFLEYIPGGSVGSCLRKHGKFEEPVVSSLTRQTLSGLAYLHHEGILHRDLKADNILLDNDGTCKISDFGISKKTDNIYGNDVTNSMQGSVFWMAPEVIRSQDSGYSAKVDIWSLGCVVLEMFAGRRPWSKEEAIGAIYKLGSLNQAPPIPDDVASAISPAALSFMYDCFNVDPADRPTADTLLRAPFCFTDPHFNFLDTDLYAKIRPNFEPVVPEH